MVDLQSLENCHPNLGLIVQQHHPAMSPKAGSGSGDAETISTAAPGGMSSGRPMRRICGSRVQSLVQAFESMISLADMDSQQCNIRKPGAELRWQPPKLCRIDEELDLSDSEGKGEAEDDDDSNSTRSEEQSLWKFSEAGSTVFNSDEKTNDEEEFSSSGSEESCPAENKENRLVTCLQPFSLRTEARGARKHFEFRKKLQKMWEEDSKLRIPMAQGLPWTTDEPEVIPKPPVKESTVPIDVRLCTEYRSMRRAQFDDYITAKIMYIEQEREERRRLQELAEQEEIKRLRKEMVPRAQLMPYFDRPFIPQRSSKRLTVPKEPNFHCSHDQNKRAKCCLVSQ